MRWIVDPSDARCSDERIAGGKGASLARLRLLGAKVPAFLVISADAYREMWQGELDRDFLDDLRAGLSQLDAAQGLAVRSSAIGEDAADASFAGLYHTSLDTLGFEAVVEAVRECWASYRNPAAVRYREEHTPAPDGAMAVVVQEMVHGDWAGVCFTANPVNQALSEGVINSVPGLGEALASGAVNPEEVTVSARDGHVLRRVAGAQAKPLPEQAIAEIWRTAKEIAERLECPQDVEWAWHDGKLFVLQSRPITTITDVFYSRMLETWKDDSESDPDGPNRIWSRMLADETWVSPISPIFYNVHNSAPGRAAFIRAHGDQVKLPPDIFKYHKAIAYCDISVIQRMYEFQPRIARPRGVLDFLPLNLQEDFRNRPFRWRGRLRRMLTNELRQREMRSFFRNYRYVQAQWPAFIEQSDRWFDLDLDSLSLEELRAHQAEVGQAMAGTGPACGTAVLHHATDLLLLLPGLLDRWCSRPGENGEILYARISSGLDDSETIRESETLWEIAHQIRELGADLTAFASLASWSEFRAKLEILPNGQGLIDEFETFWRSHRHLGSTYKDLIWPRWGDDIDECFNVVKGSLDSAALRPSIVNRRSAESRRAAQKEIVGSLRGLLAPARRRLLRWLFHYNEIYMAERDNHRHYFDRNWYELRRIYRSFGTRLTASGVLSDRDEVFFLGLAEIEAGMAGDLSGEQAGKRVAARRSVWEATLRQQGQKFLKGWAPYDDRPRGERADAKGQILGIPASPGQATGMARVVYDVRELSSVRDGQILVTRQTDPSWSTVFGRIGGLVLETGGVLSHGTSLCREYGLPCVTAVEGATVRIPDGSTIEVAGSEGTIRIISTN